MVKGEDQRDEEERKTKTHKRIKSAEPDILANILDKNSPEQTKKDPAVKN